MIDISSANRARAAVDAAAKREAEEAAKAKTTRQEQREKLKTQIEKQNSLVLFGFSYSPVDYSMA
ncbi:MAG: hypothetical protein K2O18_16875 [Oscillospiraceae bacterium]|nr:hypothetical protein [Oscillospiraceae bacterium]